MREVAEWHMTASDRTRQLPRTPLLDWSSFAGSRRLTGVHSIDDIAARCLTTSGRAAIYLALLQLRLDPGSLVLVPTYHCPTMVAPVILAGLRVAYFGIDAHGLPQLGTIDEATAAHAKAMLVSHYFGRARSLAEVRQWCDARQIALIEDCAHCYFGSAGERPVGTWGDFATASLSKFFPVPEGGVLASASRRIAAPGLTPQGLRVELKSWADVLESAVTYGRLAGVGWALTRIFAIKNQINRARTTGPQEDSIAPPDMMLACDMARIRRAPASTAVVLRRLLPHGRIIPGAGPTMRSTRGTSGRSKEHTRSTLKLGGRRRALRLSAVGRRRRPGLSEPAVTGPAGISLGQDLAGHPPSWPTTSGLPGASTCCNCSAIRI
jgi:perosamine synthetase